ncbi:MAG TPA: urease accessory protein UreE [Polyangia bacterium]|nr:urease accessory protein UreE [Polyangia bacterium]
MESTALPRLTEVAPAGAAQGTLTLSFGDRRRSRLRARLDDGREVAVLLPRGTELRDGDRLRDETGELTVAVRAAEETLSWARAEDRLLLARAAYHLGNRHVPVQIGPGWLAYQHDHVLDGMIAEMGLAVETRRAPFEPESGGYRHAGQAHSHGGHQHEH